MNSKVKNGTEHTCDGRALFIVEVPDEDVSSAACDKHLAEAVLAGNLDFGDRPVTVKSAIPGDPVKTCQWRWEDDEFAYHTWFGILETKIAETR